MVLTSESVVVDVKLEQLDCFDLLMIDSNDGVVLDTFGADCF